MSTITPNILELLGAFALGVLVTAITLWTFVGWAIEDHDDDDLNDQPPEEKHA